MPRGVKRPAAQLIEEQRALVEKKAGELKAAKARLKELEDQEQAELLAQVAHIAKEKNLTVSELLRKVK